MSPDEFRLDLPRPAFRGGAFAARDCPTGAHLPSFAHEKIDNVRADQTRGASDECAFLSSILPFGARRVERRYTILSLYEAREKLPSVRRDICRRRIGKYFVAQTAAGSRRHRRHIRSAEV